MLSLHDSASMQHALTLALDPQLKELLQARISSLVDDAYDLTEQTHFLVVQAGNSEEEIKREVGFSPLVNPIDGARYGEDGFHPFWDWLEGHQGFFEFILTVGNGGFAYVLFIEDADGVIPELLTLCRRYAGGEQ